MGSPYGVDLRKKVMELLKEGMSKSKVSALLHISMATISRWKRRVKEGKSLESIRPKSFIKKIDPKIIEDYIKEHPSATYEEMAKALGFSKTAIRHRVGQLGITRKKSHSSTKKPKKKKGKNLEEE
jgi:transposase